MITASPSSSTDVAEPERKNALRTCKVCGAAGPVRSHYLVVTCYGCKSFFRRSVIEKRKYKCDGNDACSVTSGSRAPCRACRLEKCLQVGMEPTRVKQNTRGRRGSSSRSMEINVSEADSADGLSQEEHNTSDEPLIERLIKHNQLCREGVIIDDGDFPRAIALVQRLPELPQSGRHQAGNYNFERVMSESDLMHSLYWIFRKLSTWAGGIPEFKVIPREDQIALFLHNYSALSWLHYSYHTYLVAGNMPIGVTLGNGSYIPTNQQSFEPDLPEWYTTYSLLGKQLLESVVTRLHELCLDEVEYVLLKAVLLFTPTEKLSESTRPLVATTRSRLISALTAHQERRLSEASTETRTTRCMDITLLIAPLMNVSQMEATFVQKLQNHD